MEDKVSALNFPGNIKTGRLDLSMLSLLGSILSFLAKGLGLLHSYNVLGLLWILEIFSEDEVDIYHALIKCLKMPITFYSEMVRWAWQWTTWYEFRATKKPFWSRVNFDFPQCLTLKHWDLSNSLYFIHCFPIMMVFIAIKSRIGWDRGESVKCFSERSLYKNNLGLIPSTSLFSWDSFRDYGIHKINNILWSCHSWFS